MKKECKIVQDLLPNYLEKVTNVETNEFIENHIKECEECKKVYSSMQYDINVEKIDTKEEIDYMKKFKKKFKIIRNILLIIVVIFIILIARKATILAILSNKSNKLYDSKKYEIVYDERGTGEFIDLNNYYLKSVIYKEGRILITEEYNKEGISLTTLEVYDIESKKDLVKWTSYGNGLDKVYVEEVDGNKKASTEKGTSIIAGVGTISGIISNNLMEYLRYLVFADISKVKLDGKEYYMVKIDDTERFIDIETGIIMKVRSNISNYIADYYYEFGTVTDEDIKRPEIEE